MEQDFTNLDLFDQYTHGTMSMDEKKSFEKQLQDDADLKKEYDLYKDMMMGISYASEEDMKHTISDVKKKLEQEGFFSQKGAKIINQPQRFQMTRQRWLAVAASVLVLVSAGIFIFNSGDASEKAFAQFYQPESQILSEILDQYESSGFANPNAERNETLVEALTKYESGDYIGSIADLKAFETNYPNFSIAQFYLGLSHLHQKEYSQAINQLEPLIGESSINDQSTLKWYLAIANSQLETEEAKNKSVLMLQELSDENGQYTERAKQFLQMLR